MNAEQRLRIRQTAEKSLVGSDIIEAFEYEDLSE